MMCGEVRTVTGHARRLILIARPTPSTGRSGGNESALHESPKPHIKTMCFMWKCFT